MKNTGGGCSHGFIEIQNKIPEFVDILRHEYHYIFHDGGCCWSWSSDPPDLFDGYSFAYKNEVLRDIPDRNRR